LSVHILKGRFESLDRDRDSKVSYIEAIIMAEDIMGPWDRGSADKEEIAAMARAKEVMKELDRDENNELSQREAARNDGLKQYFAAIDANRSETLDVGEMYDFLRAQAKQAEQQQKIQKRREALERFGKGGRGFGRDKRD